MFINMEEIDDLKAQAVKSLDSSRIKLYPLSKSPSLSQLCSALIPERPRVASLPRWLFTGQSRESPRRANALQDGSHEEAQAVD